MKVLFINDEHTVGGATKALCELIEQLLKHGHEPIVCTSVHDDFNDYLDRLGVKNIADGHKEAMDAVPEHIKKNKLRMLYKKAKYIIKKHRAVNVIAKGVDMNSIDLIHTNSIRNDIGCVLYKKYHIPHIMHIREFGEEDFSCTYYMPSYYQYLNENCDVFLSVSESVRQNKIRKGVIESKIRTLYDGVDFEGFKVKERNYIEDENLKLVFVGGICETKGQHIAVEAMGLLSKEIRSKVTLDIIGWNDPVFLESMKERITSLGLNDKISFLGERKDISNILANYNIGLNCSKSEGFGRITVEYMYSGLGVITSDCGANPELVSDGISGMLFDRNRPQELADKIEQLYRDPNLLETLGKQAHEYVRDRFSAQRNYEEIMNVYHEFVPKNG